MVEGRLYRFSIFLSLKFWSNIFALENRSLEAYLYIYTYFFRVEKFDPANSFLHLILVALLEICLELSYLPCGFTQQLKVLKICRDV